MNKLKYNITLLFLPENSLKLLSATCFILGIICIPISLSIVLYSLNQVPNFLVGLFIGLWAPTLIGIANFLK